MLGALCVAVAIVMLAASQATQARWAGDYEISVTDSVTISSGRWNLQPQAEGQWYHLGETQPRCPIPEGCQAAGPYDAAVGGLPINLGTYPLGSGAQVRGIYPIRLGAGSAFVGEHLRAQVHSVRIQQAPTLAPGCAEWLDLDYEYVSSVPFGPQDTLVIDVAVEMSSVTWEGEQVCSISLGTHLIDIVQVRGS